MIDIDVFEHHMVDEPPTASAELPQLADGPLFTKHADSPGSATIDGREDRMGCPQSRR